MDIVPVDSYEKPKYKSFELKTGLKLSAGVAATAMLVGMLSGCSAIERLTEIVPRSSPDTQVEVLAGDVSAPEYTPEPTWDVFDGEVGSAPYDQGDSSEESIATGSPYAQ